MNKTPTNLIFDLHGVIFDYNGKTSAKSLIYTLPPGLEILKRCAQIKDSCGKKLHKIYILSNWGKAGFDKIRQQFPEILELFDGCVISGEAGYSKPEKEIFELLINRYQIKNQPCVFIDDSEVNVIAAQQFGWTTIFYDNPAHVKQLLEKLNII